MIDKTPKGCETAKSWEFTLPSPNDDISFIFEQLIKAQSEKIPIIRSDGECTPHLRAGKGLYQALLDITLAIEDVYSNWNTPWSSPISRILTDDFLDLHLRKNGITETGNFRKACMMAIRNTLETRQHWCHQPFQIEGKKVNNPLHLGYNEKNAVSTLKNNSPEQIEEDIKKIMAMTSIEFLETYVNKPSHDLREPVNTAIASRYGDITSVLEKYDNDRLKAAESTAKKSAGKDEDYSSQIIETRERVSVNMPPDTVKDSVPKQAPIQSKKYLKKD